ncbi:hypothetical protein M758_12G081400 [Ceratodon purpureus]|nr:hypothetical protein M758_12G081400 [Ceratodon purpureus]
MAFHVACPFTCRKICSCTLGMPAPLRTQSGQHEFLQKTSALQNLLANPRLMLGGGPEYVEILVPPLPNQPKKNLEDQGAEPLDDSGDDGLTKRAGTRRKATFSIVSQADASVRSSHSKKLEAAKYASRQLASREASANGWADRERAGMSMRGGPDEELRGVDHLESLVPQVVCGLCGCGEAIGSDKAGRMLSCQTCRKQYHRKCIKHWADHRDLFNWASWTCGSCRTCEVCSRTGDPNKLMFCKRCDHAHHATCLQPPLKHVPKGPFVCPKHVRCTSCSTTVPGGGVSSKWFLSYSLCDACGRLFTRGKYCPICLKVYRDSEPAPMVCCDVCEHWVHCECDGISDEKYEEFQVNSQLRYTCASCRGECYKVADVDDAAIEVWRRKDIRDAAQIAEFRAAAVLPSQEEIAKAYPSSDEEDRDPEGNELEEASKRSSKKKVKKLPVGTEGLIKNIKTPKRLALKDGSKSKMTPSKVDGNAGKPNLILPAVKPEKNMTSTKKSKRGSTPSGDGQERLLRNEDPISNPVAEGKDTEKTKKTVPTKKIVPPAGGDAAPKDKKRNSEDPKEKSLSTKKKRSSKASELDTVRSDILEAGLGKTEKLKTTNRQEIAVRQDQTEVPSASSEGHVIEECSHGGKERASIKVAKKESDFDLTSAGTYSASHGEAATMPEPQIEVGDTENNEGTQQSQPGRGSSPLHWAGHSDSVRRRRVPSSKYRDMDTSVWRHARTNKDLPSTQNPEPGPAQAFNERIEATTPAPKAPPLPSIADSRKERRRKPDNVEDNVDNDDSLEVPRKKLKVTELSEKKADVQLSHNSPASDSPATARFLRVKIRKQPSRETVTPAGSKDSKKSEEEVEETAHVKGQQPSKKKRSATSQKSVEDSAQRRLAIGDTAGDDSWILQRLGTDAISKRVEIFWPIDDIWYKGTVVAVFPDKLKFSVDYDDGEQETLEFGKEKVRLLSTTKKA